MIDNQTDGSTRQPTKTTTKENENGTLCRSSWVGSSSVCRDMTWEPQGGGFKSRSPAQATLLSVNWKLERCQFTAEEAFTKGSP